MRFAMAFPYNNRPQLVTRFITVKHKSRPAGIPPIRMHFHPALYHELIYVDYGSINLIVADQKFRLGSGECMFINGIDYHSFAGTDGLPFDFLNIMFYGEVPEVLFSKKITVSRECHELMAKMREESIDEMKHYEELCSCYLTELIITLWRQETLELPKTFPEAAYQQNYHSEVVRRAVALIGENYREPLTLEQLSKALGISISHLRFLLKRETGKSFTTLLHERRVEAAKHLLRKGTLSLSGISEAIGYASTSFFFRVFRNQTGMTPKAYARSLGDTNAN